MKRPRTHAALHRLLRATAIAMLAWPLLAASGAFEEAPASRAGSPVAVCVVVHPETPERSLDEDRLQRIYLGKVRNWSNGKRIIVVTLREGAVHQAFLKDHVGRTPSQFRNYWRQRLFSGQGTLPVVLDTEREVLEFVARTRGAVGYVGSDVSTAGVAGVELR